MTLRPAIGFVAIGRNEGARFHRCLASLKRAGERVVYVDSGSADDSVAYARSEGAAVVELSADKPFTAARARNAGFSALMEAWPDTECVLFIDGDCELADGFAQAAADELSGDDTLGIVTGRCRELYPDATVYNRLCDMEWNGPVGDIEACGGIFMVRAKLFSDVGGFNPSVIAAEDDEFCIRVRAAGARIRRIGRDICFHDANIRRFGQWWRRMTRAGHAYAQVSELHPGYFRAQRLRAWGWGFALPAVALIGAPFTQGWSLALLLLYPVSLVSTRAKLIRSGAATRHATVGAAFMTLSKFPNFQGMIGYWRKRISGRRPAIVEYK